MSSITDKTAETKQDKQESSREVFYADGFHYSFILTNSPGKRLAPNAYGVYEPADEAQVELLKHQVSKGLISFGVFPPAVVTEEEKGE